jgi:hypothetical protein
VVELNALELTLMAALGVLVAINIGVLAWASYLNRKTHERPRPNIYEVHLEGAAVFSDVELAEVKKQAKAQLAKAADDAAARLQKSLNTSVDQAAASIHTLLMADLRSEFGKYQVSLAALRDQTVGEFTKMHQELDQRKQELLNELERDIAAERVTRR